MNLEKYKLPMHVAAALSSGRAQLLNLAPVALDENAQREMIRLLIEHGRARDRRQQYRSG